MVIDSFSILDWEKLDKIGKLDNCKWNNQNSVFGKNSFVLEICFFQAVNVSLYYFSKYSKCQSIVHVYLDLCRQRIDFLYTSW